MEIRRAERNDGAKDGFARARRAMSQRAEKADQAANAHQRAEGQPEMRVALIVQFRFGAIRRRREEQ
jgi:hypothetical protein